MSGKLRAYPMRAQNIVNISCFVCYCYNMDLLKRVRDILDNSIENILEVIQFVYENKDSICDLALNKDLSENDFYKITSILTSQSRSPLWERYYILKNNFKKLKSTLGRGDLIMDDKYCEYKISGFNATNTLNIVQIRLHHNCDYIIEYVHFDKKYSFMLTHKQMEKECSLIGTSAHGTKKHNEKNKNIEYRISIQYDSDIWNRWVTDYLFCE